jgi:lysophospholipase L1-like esterase
MEYTIEDLTPFVFSLPWFGKEDFKLQRFPTSTLSNLPLSIQELAKHPAGGMLRFRTRSDVIAFETFRPKDPLRDRFSPLSQYGLDIYCDNRWYNSLICREGSQFQWINLDGENEHDYTIYFPTYSSLEIRTLALEGEVSRFPKSDYPDGPVLSSPSAFYIPGKIVVYGSSITQGANASRPGLAYPARIGRLMNAEVINLGFSGSGKGEHEISELLAAIPEVSLYILDWGCNIWAPHEVNLIKERYPYMIRQIRKFHPHVPIIYINTQTFFGEFSDPEMAKSFKIIRETIYANYEQDRTAGNPCAFIEGRDIIGPTDWDCTVDGAHCNDWGFTRYVEAIVPHIRKFFPDGK